MLYTRKGDKGKTSTYGCNQKISKSSAVAEALGALDETNSFLGLVKSESAGIEWEINESIFRLRDLIHSVQESLFIIQAEIAGFPKSIKREKIIELEKIIDGIEKILPPIKTFFISGGDRISALFDTSRTIARRAERRIVTVCEEGKVKVSDNSLAYMNRLSSLLYALARLSNHKSGINEVPPSYE